MNSYVQDATVDWLVKSILVDVRLFYLPEGWELIAQFEQFVKEEFRFLRCSELRTFFFSTVSSASFETRISTSSSD